MSYLKTDQKVINFDNIEEVNKAYNNGYVLTRLGKGVINQTRSLRINLENFEFNSENRRIFRKTEDVNCELKSLPLEDYSWEIHKLGKEFYTKKFGSKTMSASKIKELFNDSIKSNLNSVFTYTSNESKIGYCLSYVNDEMVHYSYPFYNLEFDNPNLGMGMMLKAIKWALENNKKYIYLGSIVTQESKYKLQFNNLEWWDTEKNLWSKDIEKLKIKL